MASSAHTGGIVIVLRPADHPPPIAIEKRIAEILARLLGQGTMAR